MLNLLDTNDNSKSENLDSQSCEPAPIELPVDGTLDLHLFSPKEVKELVPDYLTLCREKNILSVRIIHGKGIGALRNTVHSILKKLPEVTSFQLARPELGSWGATVVELYPFENKNT